MSTLRRFYVYAMALIALEVWLWSLERLLAKLARHAPHTDFALPLAGFLVGVLVFALHWYWAQSEAKRSPDENRAALRVAALYLALALTWGGAFHAAAGALAKALALAIHQSGIRFMFAYSSWAALAAALALNALAALYFESVLRRVPMDEVGAQIRLVYRYAWLSYALGWLAIGGTMLLKALFDYARLASGATPRLVSGVTSTYEAAELRALLKSSEIASRLVGGATLAVGGLALLAVWGRRWWKETLRSEERFSDVVVAFLLSWALSGIAVGLVALGAGIRGTLEFLLGASVLSAFNSALRYTVSVGVPWLALWLFAQYALRRALDGRDEDARAAIYRFELAVLAFGGLVALTFGVSSLMAYVANAIWRVATSVSVLTGGVAWALLGVLVWGVAWNAMRREIATFPEAPRSLTYRLYLYGITFLAVLGLMVFGTMALYRVLLLLLGVHIHKIAPLAYDLGMVLWSAALVFAHGRLLGDFRHAEAEMLKERFPVLVLGGSAPWVEHLLADEGFSLTVVSPDEPPPEADFAAVVVDGGLLADLPDSWRLWLGKYGGARLVVPSPEGWLWLSAAVEPPRTQARRIRAALRSLAEGRKPHLNPLTVWWKIFAYIGAIALALFLLQTIAAIFAMFSLIATHAGM